MSVVCGKLYVGVDLLLKDEFFAFCGKKNFLELLSLSKNELMSSQVRMRSRAYGLMSLRAKASFFRLSRVKF